MIGISNFPWQFVREIGHPDCLSGELRHLHNIVMQRKGERPVNGSMVEEGIEDYFMRSREEFEYKKLTKFKLDRNLDESGPLKRKNTILWGDKWG
ncbi:hypothetical protein NPIL_255741 [Nephila pilipes]|uniref:Uncharacterized protein n=1 Tax=Nephila pilipes TaxID=299642 RepID=A0A8X6NUA7_NEPPI|nr:hypothetical protein NPIL_255741 [Nephila pilipes]